MAVIKKIIIISILILVLGAVAIFVGAFVNAVNRVERVVEDVKLLDACQVQLANIDNMLSKYQQTHEGKYPMSLEEIFDQDAGSRRWELLICPSKRGDKSTNSYVYTGAGLDDTAPAEMIIAYDRFCHIDGLRNVLFVGSDEDLEVGGNRVQGLSEDKFNAAIERDALLRENPGE